MLDCIANSDLLPTSELKKLEEEYKNLVRNGYSEKAAEKRISNLVVQAEYKILSEQLNMLKTEMSLPQTSAPLLDNAFFELIGSFDNKISGKTNQTTATEIEIEKMLREAAETPSDDDDAPARVMLENTVAETEDWSVLEKWFEKNLPGVPVYRLKNIIQSKSGRTAWGMFKDAAIYLYENAEVGTAYHEAFEAVWATFLDDTEKNLLVDEFRKREGSFTDRPSGRTVKYSDATLDEVREQLAEEFRDYVQFNKRPPLPGKQYSGIMKMFVDLLRYIRSFFIGPKSQSNVASLFEKLNEGGFALPSMENSDMLGIVDVDTADSDNAVFRVVQTPGLSDFERSEIIQNMTYHLMKDLVTSNKNLFEIPNMNKEEVYAKLKTAVLKDLATLHQIVGKNNDSENNNVVKAAQKKVKDTMAAVIDNWPTIIAKHEEYIRSYSIEFDENDEMQRRDENKVRESDYVDARKVDHFKKANAAIKLLLSSIPLVKTESGIVKIKRNHQVYGANLIPASQVFITLMNRLHNSVNIDDMFAKLKTLAREDVHYDTLYKRLTKQSASVEGEIDYSKITDQHHIQLITAFWRTFKKSNPDVKVVSILPTGETVVGEAYLSSVANQIRTDFVTDIVNRANMKKGYLMLVRNENNRRVFRGDPERIKNVKLTNAPMMIEFLKNLGIDFTQQEYNKLSETDRQKFRDTIGGIFESLKSAKDIVNLSKQSLDISGRLLDLAYLKGKLTVSDYSSTFFGVENQRKQSFIGTNIVSKFEDFIRSLQEFTESSVNDSIYRYLKTDKFSRNSVILGKMFNKNGKKVMGRESENLLRVGYLDGTIDETNGKRKPTDKYNRIERITAEINMNLQGWYMNLVPGDAGIEWAVYMGNHVSLDELYRGMTKVHNIFKGYFLDELETSREKRPIKQVKDRKTTDLRFFKGILSPKLHDAIVSAKGTPEEVYAKFQGEINSAINAFFEEKTKKLNDSLTQIGALVAGDSGYRGNKISFPSEMTEEEVKYRLKQLEVNYVINNIEFHKIYYSDPYQYSDELKRIKNFNSPRQEMLSGSSNMNSAINRIWNRNFRRKDDVGHYDFTRDYFRTASVIDVKAKDDLERYDTYEETDGAGIISYKAYRNFRIRLGEWSELEEKQYIYEIAYEKTEKGIPLSDVEMDVYFAGNPQVRSAFVPLKPIVTGQKLSDNGSPRDRNDVVMDKFALYPISYRTTRELNREGNISRLFDKMSSEDIDYIVFDSGRKVGSEGSIQAYDENGMLNSQPFNPVNVPLSIVSLQTEVPSKEDEKSPRGTQVTKLVTMDLMDNGVPIDFMPEETFQKRLQAWESIPKGSRSTFLFDEIRKNQTILETLTQLGYQRLIKSLGIRETETGYEIADLSKTAKVLREEILKRETNDNISDAINAFLDGTSLLEATPAYQQVRNILYSIADREVVSPRLTGGMKVQIPSTFLESQRVVKETDSKGNVVYTADTLGFYKDEDGKRVIEVMVGRWFDSHRTDAELLEYLNTTPEGQKILSGLSYRIPTQKQNSIDRFVIKKFLPYEMGDMVIVPSQIVKKAGGDFDIDKLTMYFKNIKTGNRNGFPVYVPFLTDANSTAVQRYIKWVKSMIDSDDAKYIALLSNNAIKEIKEEFRQRRYALRRERYSRIDAEKDALYGEYTSELQQRIDETNFSVEERIQEIFEIGKNLYHNLPFDAIQHYRAVKEEIRRNDISGPREIEYYLSLTLRLMESNSFPEVNDILEMMVDNYEESLRVLGISADYLNELKSTLLENFRTKKEFSIGQIKKESDAVFEQIKAERDAITEDIQFQGAVDMAQAEGLYTFEEFRDLSIYDQNTKRALENEYVESSERLIAFPQSFNRLVQPNSADLLKDLSKTVATKTKGSTFDYSSVPNMMDRSFMTGLRSAFLIGKYAIGIAAVNQTNHSLNQRSVTTIDPERFDRWSKTDQWFLSSGTYDKSHSVVKFPKFNTAVKNGRKLATLSGIVDASGKNDISDILSQFIDGYVDISKGPWIMEMGAAPNVASTYMFLIKLGVPVREVVFFMNQPIVQSYLNRIEGAGYSWLFIDSFVEEMFELYSKNDKTDVNLDRKIPSATYLESQLGRKPQEMSVQELEEQRFMLLEFLKYAKMAEHMFLITQGSNFDTASLNDPFLIFKKQKQLEKAQSTIIDGVENILGDSFIGMLSAAMTGVRNAYSTILKSDGKSVRNVLEKVLEPYVTLNDMDFLSVAQKAVADIFDWAVQTDTGLNSRIKEILITNGGVTSRVASLLEEIKANPSHPLANNTVIKVMQPLLSASTEEDRVNVLKIKSLENKVYDQNNLIYGFRQLKEYFQKNNSKMYDDIITLAILQSGLSRSSISFTSVIPFEDFEKVYNATISKLDRIPNLSLFHTLGVFYRNNWNNDVIVPQRRAISVPTAKGPRYNPSMEFFPESIKNAVAQKKIPPIMTVAVNSKMNHDHLVYSWDDNISGKAKDAMRRKGDFSFMHKALFKMVRDQSGEPVIHRVENKNKGRIDEYYIFKAMNAWGDGQFANEYYTMDKQSVINNRMEKVTDVNDIVIADMVEKIQKVKFDKLQPKGLPPMNRTAKKC